MKRNSVLVQITENYLRFHEISYSNYKQRYIRNNLCGIKNLNDDQIVKNIKNNTVFLRKRSKNAKLILPSQFAVSRQLLVPSHDKSEIKKILALSQANEIPCSIEEIVFDFFVIDKENSGYSKILFFFTIPDVWERFMRLFRKAGVNVCEITLMPFSLLDWQIAIKNDMALGIVNIDIDNFEIAFCYKKKLLFFRGFMKEEISLRFFESSIKEIKETIDFYDKEKLGPKIEKLLIVSQNSNKDYEEQLRRQINIPCSTENLRDVFTFVPNPSLRGNTVIDFMSKQEKDLRQRYALRKKILKMGLIMFLMAVSLSASFFNTVFYKKKNLNEYELEIQKLSELENKSKRIIFTADFLRKELSGRIIVPELFKQLSELAGEELIISFFNIDKGKEITIKGFANNEVEASNFKDALFESDYFKEVNCEYITKKHFFGREIYDFKISFKAN